MVTKVKTLTNRQKLEALASGSETIQSLFGISQMEDDDLPESIKSRILEIAINSKKIKQRIHSNIGQSIR